MIVDYLLILNILRIDVQAIQWLDSTHKHTCLILVVTFHLSIIAALIAGVSMRPAALILFRVDTGTDLVTRPHTHSIDAEGTEHHGEGDEQKNQS